MDPRSNQTTEEKSCRLQDCLLPAAGCLWAVVDRICQCAGGELWLSCDLARGRRGTENGSISVELVVKSSAEYIDVQVE